MKQDEQRKVGKKKSKNLGQPLLDPVASQSTQSSLSISSQPPEHVVEASQPNTYQTLCFALNFDKEWKLEHAGWSLIGDYTSGLGVYLPLIFSRDYRGVGLATMVANLLYSLSIGGFQKDPYFLLNLDSLNPNQSPCTYWLGSFLAGQSQAVKFLVMMALGSEVAYATNLISKYPDSALFVYAYAVMSVLLTFVMLCYAGYKTRDALARTALNCWNHLTTTNATANPVVVNAAVTTANPLGTNTSSLPNNTLSGGGSNRMYVAPVITETSQKNQSEVVYEV